MRYYEVAPTKIVRQDSYTYTYSSDIQLSLGNIVNIPLGNRQLIAIVIREVDKPAYATRSIGSLIEQSPIPSQLIELSLWLSKYYATHLSLVLQMILPSGIQKNRRIRKIVTGEKIRSKSIINFNSYQSAAINKITSGENGETYMLHGVTGSGKTAVYIEIIKQTLEQKKSAIVLVPEIALTAQLVDDFSNHFSNLILTHSAQTDAERHLIWKKVLEDKSPKVIVGPRSALFQPIDNVGIIIVDEAHEPSYKQEQSPKYSALRAAKILAIAHNAKLILGSATPSISDYYIAKATKHPIISLPVRAKETKKPNLILVDMRIRTNFTKHRFLSDKLLENINETLNIGGQVLIFHNRRGSSPINICDRCGWQSNCPKCFIPMTLHADDYILRCHTCGHRDKVPTACPVCTNVSIIHRGVGTKLIEAELNKIFPKTRISRFDGDSTETINSKYKDIYSGEVDIIVGTQIVAKGLDLPNLRTVGVIQADAGLSLPDFSASERTFQLIAQVVGRVGRTNHQTSVIIQSFQPQNAAISDGMTQNYEDFYEKTLNVRKKTNFPPFSYVLRLTCAYKTEQTAIKNTRSLAKTLQSKLPGDVEILGPVPAFYERQGGYYRWQLVLKSKKRSSLLAAIGFLPNTNWQFDIDPARLI